MENPMDAKNEKELLWQLAESKKRGEQMMKKLEALEAAERLNAPRAEGESATTPPEAPLLNQGGEGGGNAESATAPERPRRVNLLNKKFAGNIEAPEPASKKELEKLEKGRNAKEKAYKALFDEAEKAGKPSKLAKVGKFAKETAGSAVSYVAKHGKGTIASTIRAGMAVGRGVKKTVGGARMAGEVVDEPVAGEMGEYNPKPKTDKKTVLESHAPKIDLLKNKAEKVQAYKKGLMQIDQYQEARAARKKEKEAREQAERAAKEKAEAPKSPAEQVKNFVEEFQLEGILPAEFHNLDEAQKLKVAQDLKRRVVDIVKSDAQTQYSEGFRDKQKTGIEKIRASINKNLKIKKLEHEIFEKLKNTPEGREIIRRDLETLVNKTESRKISVDENGNARINFVNPDSIDSPTPAELEKIAEFNLAANNFVQKPYEWGQEKGGGHKKEYDKVKAEYEKARSEILEIKKSREGRDEQGKAVVEVMEMDNAIKLEQLLNTHPEYEQALNDFAKEAGGKEVGKDFLGFVNTITGRNMINRALIAGGFGARMAARGAAILTGWTGITFAGSTLVGGVIGGIRGRIRGKETLAERQKQARHGQKDTSKERVAVTNAAKLNRRLEKLLTEIEKNINEGKEDEAKKKLSMLSARIAHTQGKIEKGQVNFGESKIALENQFKLLNNLNTAMTVQEYVHEKDAKLKERIDRMLAASGKNIAERTALAQNEFVKQQMYKGAMLGAGLAFAGYGVRWFGEHMGWWGHAEAATAGSKTAGAEEEGFVERTQNWLSRMTHRTWQYIRHPTGGTPEQEMPTTPPRTHDALADLRTGHGNVGANAESLLKKEPDEIPAAPENVSVKPEAIVKAGKGIEHAFRNQIEGDETLARSLGYEGPAGDKTALHQFSGGAAHRLALDHGYVDKTTGEEIWVKEPDKVAYEIKLDKEGHPTIEEKLVGATTSEPHPRGTEFEKEVEPYEYKHAAYHEPVHGAEAGSVPAEISPVKEIPVSKGDAVDYTSWGNTPGQSHAEAVAQAREAVAAKMAAAQTAAETPPTAPSAQPETENLSGAMSRHPEFMRNEYHLSGEKLAQAYSAREKDLNYLFGSEHSPEWHKLAERNASAVLKSNPDTQHPLVGNWIKYLKTMKDYTGLKPRSGFLGFRAENAEHYMARGLQKLAQTPGKLEKFQDDVRSSVAGKL